MQGVLPGVLSATDPFEMADISSFTLGIDNGDGTRSAPASMTDPKYVFITLDNDRSTLYVDNKRSAGLIMTDVAHEKGDQVLMNVAAVADSLPQTIANEVLVSILDYPGVRTSLTAEKEIVEACEDNTITVDYYSDVGGENSSVILTTSIPLPLTVNAITHTRNDATVASGVSATPTTLTASDYTLTQTGGMSVYTINATQLLTQALGLS